MKTTLAALSCFCCARPLTAAEAFVASERAVTKKGQIRPDSPVVCRAHRGTVAVSVQEILDARKARKEAQQDAEEALRFARQKAAQQAQAKRRNRARAKELEAEARVEQALAAREARRLKRLSSPKERALAILTA